MLPDIKERIIGLINEPGYKPLKKSEIAKIFGILSSDLDDYHELINSMIENHEIALSSKKAIINLSNTNLVKGKYVSTKKRFGFIEIDSEDRDIFIRDEDAGSVMDGDTVLVKITKKAEAGFRAEGQIVEIIERFNKKIVGTFTKSSSFGFVIANNKKIKTDIFISKMYFSGATNNDKVVCEIVKWPENGKKPEGKIIEVLGQVGDRYVEIDSIVRQHNLPDSFPRKVRNQVEMIPDKITKSEMKNRLDLRDELIYTIDGDDSKDFDDAVNIKRLDNGNFELGVHIADVTHYVTENSPLDRDALKRATSVYLVDKVIPMLPKKLSNGICSLNPNVDRLTLSVMMEVNDEAKVVDYKIAKTVINSKARMTYTKVSDILEKRDENLIKEYAHLLESFKDAEKLAKMLMQKRNKRGAIDFDFEESKIKLSDEGIPVAIEPYERRISNKIIEEFMLLTNEVVAQHYFKLEYPFVYRVHEKPDEEKILNLGRFVTALGYKNDLAKGNVKPMDLQKILKKIDKIDEKQAIGTIMLRSLKQARYSPNCEGHFGLAAEFYSHFTSPIRRYPDLQIHRIIKDDLDGKLNEKRKKHYNMILEDVCNQSSTQERVAEVAERDVDDYYKAVYMENKEGQQFAGHISSVTSFGMFIELDNGIEGLIRVNDLPDYYNYVESTQTLVGERTGVIYKLGQEIDIVVKKSNPETREIDFRLA